MNKKKIGLAILASFFVGLLFGTMFVTTNSISVIMGIKYLSTSDYTILSDGFCCHAYGTLNFSETNAATVIQNVFNQKPNSVFFKAGDYDLMGATVTAYCPIIIEGEGRNTVLRNGTLKVVGEGWQSNNINVVKHIFFEADGDTICLWFNGVVHGFVEANVLYHTDFGVGIPLLCLTDCLTIRVRDNWFDGCNTQIIKINGTRPTPQLHIISNNDFGSTLPIPFPTYTYPWEAAAVYIQGSTNWGNTISDNLGYLAPENIFVYSEAYRTKVKFNQITCGQDNYLINLYGDQNAVVGNDIIMDNAKGAIAIRNSNSNANTIELNNIQGVNYETTILFTEEDC